MLVSKTNKVNKERYTDKIMIRYLMQFRIGRSLLSRSKKNIR